MACVRSGVVLVALLFAPWQLVLAQRNFGFDNSKPSGQPYLSPEESLSRMRVPAGFEVTLFAAEPDVINPIAFTVDERGRLWVVECYEYPRRTQPGKKPRDRIKLLEDTTGSGKADRVTTWAEGKDLPTGWDLASSIEVGNGGVYLGAAPHLFFLRDTQGQGKCDSQEILLSGFGSQDTHETLNTLQWGPDGRLHGLHGIFTHSKIGDVQLNAAVWRYHPAQKKFDIFAEGTSNPWGLDFDPNGQAFLTACVIPHAFHMIPGGTYIRQAGTSFNQHSYGLLREISDHMHHQESGWAHAGALVLQGEQFPAEYRGSLLMGSIHGCSIKRDVLERRGSTFVAKHAPDFLVSGDKNFRPINLRWGPNGEIYVIDWHDQNPCHQAKPESWDLNRGRIYKIQPTGTKPRPPGDLARKSSAELVELLKRSNAWWHRTALRLLAERRDHTVVASLQSMLFDKAAEPFALRALWALYVSDGFDERLAAKALAHTNSWVRAWSIRLLGEQGAFSGPILAQLVQLATTDPAPEVRLQLAATAQRMPRDESQALRLLQELMQHRDDAKDACLPLMIWLAYEPRLVARSQSNLDWLAQNALGNPLIADEIVPRTMRRLVATGSAKELAAAIGFLDRVRDSAVRRRALDGLVQALQNQQVDPPEGWKRVLADLGQDGDAEVRNLARRLSVNFRDVAAMRKSLAIARDEQKPVGERVDAIRDLAVARPVEALKPLYELIASAEPVEVRCEACRALAGFTRPELARELIAQWQKYPAIVRGEVVNVLAGRREWANDLLAAVGENRVARTELTDSTILRIRAFKDKKLNGLIESVWGRVRDTPADVDALIDRMRLTLYEDRGSAARGRVVFESQCAKCHRFDGKGHDVGPNLDGAARDIEYLLVNILDPNRVIGQPYYTRFVALKDGRVETGLLAAEDERSITIKGENSALKVFLKKDVDEISVQPKSVMPEGLTNTMTVQDFRDLICYIMASPYLTAVSVAGPFTGKEPPALELASPLRTKDVVWTSPRVGPPGRIVLPPSGKGSAVAFVAAEITAAENVTTRLQLGSGHLVQAWLNGSPVYRQNPGNETIPDQAAVDVTLRQGKNQLVFQITYEGDKAVLYARLLDPSRKLQHPTPPR